MPIKKENKHLYPKAHEWICIRRDILSRANHACEFCGVKNKAVGMRDKSGAFWTEDQIVSKLQDEGGDLIKEMEYKPLVIVLTIAHLDHNPSNNDYQNLRALCQKCHLTYDAKHHAKNAKETRRKKKGQEVLPL